jgi:hypothetical protein
MEMKNPPFGGWDFYKRFEILAEASCDGLSDAIESGFGMWRHVEEIPQFLARILRTIGAVDYFMPHSAQTNLTNLAVTKMDVTLGCAAVAVDILRLNVAAILFRPILSDLGPCRVIVIPGRNVSGTIIADQTAIGNKFFHRISCKILAVSVDE